MLIGRLPTLQTLQKRIAHHGFATLQVKPVVILGNNNSEVKRPTVPNGCIKCDVDSWVRHASSWFIHAMRFSVRTVASRQSERRHLDHASAFPVWSSSYYKTPTHLHVSRWNKISLNFQQLCQPLMGSPPCHGSSTLFATLHACQRKRLSMVSVTGPMAVDRQSLVLGGDQATILFWPI